jgi:hypothetical protein
MGFDAGSEAALSENMVAKAGGAGAAELGGEHTIGDVGAAIKDLAETKVGALVGRYDGKETFEFGSMGRVDNGDRLGSVTGWRGNWSGTSGRRYTRDTSGCLTRGGSVGVGGWGRSLDGDGEKERGQITSGGDLELAEIGDVKDGEDSRWVIFVGLGLGKLG